MTSARLNPPTVEEECCFIVDSGCPCEGCIVLGPNQCMNSTGWFYLVLHCHTTSNGCHALGSVPFSDSRALGLFRDILWDRIVARITWKKKLFSFLTALPEWRVLEATRKPHDAARLQFSEVVYGLIRCLSFFSFTSQHTLSLFFVGFWVALCVLPLLFVQLRGSDKTCLCSREQRSSCVKYADTQLCLSPSVAIWIVSLAIKSLYRGEKVCNFHTVRQFLLNVYRRCRRAS